MTVLEAVTVGARRIERREAVLLLEQVAGLKRLEIFARPDTPLGLRAERSYLRKLSRRAAGEPLQYLLGEWEFWSLSFRVDRRALIPRPETELLVEETLKIAANLQQPVLVDVGTGTGCLAVTLARELPRSHIVATDISSAALRLARENARRHGVERRIAFRRGDLMSAVPGGLRANVLLSNPPYVPTAELAAAQELSYEPALALDGGSDGLTFYRLLARQAAASLVPGGHLLLEVGDGQAARVAELLEQHRWLEVGALPDLAGELRLVHGRRP